MNYELAKMDYERLRKLQRDVKLSHRRYRKVTALVMLHQGHSIEVIEAALGLDDNTIRCYWEGYEDKGIETYLSDHFVTYSGKLTPGQEEQLAAHLDEYLYSDVNPIIQYLREQYEVEYTLNRMRDLLHRLGFVYKQTKAVPSKADEAVHRDFVEDVSPMLLEEVASGTAKDYFSSGCHPTHNTKTSHGWICRGQDFDVDCISGYRHANINAAVRATKPVYVVYDMTEAIDAPSTQRLCRQLLRKDSHKKICLICNNPRYNRNRLLQEWAEQQLIEFVYLPAYLPNFNLAKRSWRLFRKGVIYSLYYGTHDKIRTGIIKFLEDAKTYRDELLSLLTLNFRTVNGFALHVQTTS